MRVAAANAINLMIAIACFNAIGVARTVSSCIMMGQARDFFDSNWPGHWRRHRLPRLAGRDWSSSLQ